MAYTIAEVAEEVRFLLGGLSCDLIDDTLLTTIISRNVNDILLPDDERCQVVYDSVLDTLRFLIRKLVSDSGKNVKEAISASDASSTAVAGAVVEVEEEIGKRKKRVKYSDGSGSSSSAGSVVTIANMKTMYEAMLEDFLKNPQYVCDSLVSSGGDDSASGGGLVKIGITKDRFETSSPFRASICNFWD